MNYLKQFFPMGEHAQTAGEEMEIVLYYTKGGPNWFTGGQIRRGLYVSFTPVRRDDTSVTRTLGDDRGRRHLVAEMPRKNDRTGEEWVKRITPHLPDLARAACNQDWALCHQILTRDAVPA